MAFTKIVSPGIDTTGSYTVQELNTVGVMTAGTVQVGSATTVHTTGIDLGSGNITSHNINSTGIITATSFVGPVTGNITGDITATSGTFSGNVSIAGTLTYEDVTNVDSVGVITARNGLNVTGGNIGIGENNPQNSLHISGSAPAIRFVDSGANGSAFSIIEDNNGLLKLRNDAGNSGTGSGIAFEVDAAERVRIDSAGNFGINKNAPTSVLDVRQTNTGAATEIKLFNLDQ